MRTAPFGVRVAVLSLAVAQSASADEHALLVDSVVYSVPNGMRETLRWRVGSDGTGEIQHIYDRRDGRVTELRRYRLRLPPEALSRFHSLTQAARSTAQRVPQCGRVTIDGLAGSFQWVGPTNNFRFDLGGGCSSPIHDEARSLLENANQIVEDFAIIDSEPFEVDRFP